MSEPRRFPAPWTVSDYNDACFIVQDAEGRRLSYVYYAEGDARISNPNALTKQEAFRMASWIARSPDLMPKDGPDSRTGSSATASAAD